MRGADKSRNLVAAIAYFLGFVTGLVILLVEKEDRFIRFHAWQSTLVFGFLFLLNLVLNLFSGFFSGAVGSLIFIVALIIWLVSIVKAWRGEMFKWPIAGNFAEKQVR